MYTNIMSILRCPLCGTRFDLVESQTENEEVVEGKIVCKKGHVFSVHEGVLDLNSQEQEGLNSWNEYYQEESYDDLDRALDAHDTQTQRKNRQAFLAGIVEEAKKLVNGYLLDAASGRGLLLRELLKNVDASVSIIATDLSFQVLKYDRIKLKESAPRVRVNYIACDATHLPLQNNSVDMVCTFVGFVNMMDLMEDGIKDASRVLKSGAPLIDSAVYMDENAAGAQRAAGFLKDNGMAGAEKMFIRRELLAIHRKYFKTVHEKIVYEGIAENTEADLIPCEGEWFANAVIIAQ